VRCAFGHRFVDGSGVALAMMLERELVELIP
jgi:hypothetical protein